MNTFLDRARDHFENIRPRTAEGRVVTGADALAIAGIVGVAARLEFAAARQGNVDGIASAGVVLGAAAAVQEVYERGVVAIATDAMQDILPV